MINLKDITLLTVTSVEIDDTVEVLKHSMQGLNFAKVKFISHIKPQNLPADIEYCKCDKISSLEAYSKFMIYELAKYVDTPYCLTIHRDGFVVNPEMWRGSFLDYDYIGAPWPVDNAFKTEDGIYERVGNGGFSFRSKKLLEMPSKLNLKFEEFNNCKHEDVMLCVQYKKVLEEHGIKFADIEEAKYFSHEFELPELKGIEPFGFHKYRGKNKKYPKFPTKFSKIKRKYGFEKVYNYE